jgi:hypothetical protein
MLHIPPRFELEIQVPSVNHRTAPSGNWSPIMVKPANPLDMVQLLLLLLISTLHPTSHLSVLFSLSFKLLLIYSYFNTHFFLHPFLLLLACVPLGYQTVTETRNNESWAKGPTVSTFVFASRKIQSLYEQLPRTATRESWNGANSDISKPRTWSLWCHR